MSKATKLSNLWTLQFHNMKKVKIAGVTVNLNHETLKFKSFDELKKKEEVFSHLESEDRANAQTELGKVLGIIKESVPPTAPTTEPGK